MADKRGRAATRAGSSIVSALETAWEVIRSRHPELPGVVIITGSGTQPGGLVWGHHAAERWATKHAPAVQRSTEIFISGERLDGGATLTLQTLLHEAAHALARVRGTKDTSRGHRYHNKRFVATANELGLEYRHDTPHSSIGFSAVEITDATVEAYATVIAMLDAEITASLPGPAPIAGGGTGGTTGGGMTLIGGGSKRGGNTRMKLTCECGRNLTIGTKQHSEGPVICGLCKSEFTA